ncbi:hypothetical protein JOD43_000596 [Pullulanibacillus pueri]|uniref:Uncharacterized protein n=1 Tax=Pullulanibacillus pueri TaxID=1437324 RepID=A0A8J3EL47_9BACL|nr:hypothetical protein [Pullulanibacillus pueri]MBM7680437.1 hypothetical protein [Pullulanibacillus pueri]GGH75095.1 hypothetical protein GCM10007096_03960 [Pullulanibacillus pueri]
MFKRVFKHIFIPRRSKSNVLFFPKVDYQNDIHEATRSTRHYLLELLRLQGYIVEENLFLNEHFFDILIPEYRYIIYCSLSDPDDVMTKVFHKRLKNIATAHGYRLCVISKSHFYKDLHHLLALLKLNLH